MPNPTPIIISHDLGKDRDDSIALEALLIALKSGLLPKDQKMIFVTSDGIRCNKDGKQDPSGLYDQRTLATYVQIKKFQQEIGLSEEQSKNIFIVAGEETSYQDFDLDSRKFTVGESEALYELEGQLKKDLEAVKLTEEEFENAKFRSNWFENKIFQSELRKL